MFYIDFLLKYRMGYVDFSLVGVLYVVKDFKGRDGFLELICFG